MLKLEPKYRLVQLQILCSLRLPTLPLQWQPNFPCCKIQVQGESLAVLAETGSNLISKMVQVCTNDGTLPTTQVVRGQTLLETHLLIRWLIGVWGWACPLGAHWRSRATVDLHQPSGTPPFSPLCCKRSITLTASPGHLRKQRNSLIILIIVDTVMGMLGTQPPL